MKKIVLFAVIGLLAALGIAALGRARVEVAKDKAIAKIDQLLGNAEVKRKEIELSVAGLKDGLREIQKAKIAMQVKYEQIGRRAEPVEQEVAKIDASLRRLRDHLRSVERQRAAREGGVGDRELDELVSSGLVLDEKLAAKGQVPLELDDGLNKQFEKRTPR